MSSWPMVATMNTTKTRAAARRSSDWTRSTTLGPATVIIGRADDHDDRADLRHRAAGRGTEEQRRGVVTERDRDHRADHHDRGQVAEPGGYADQPAAAEPVQQVNDEPPDDG